MVLTRRSHCPNVRRASAVLGVKTSKPLLPVRVVPSPEGLQGARPPKSPGGRKQPSPYIRQLKLGPLYGVPKRGAESICMLSHSRSYNISLGQPSHAPPTPSARAWCAWVCACDCIVCLFVCVRMRVREKKTPSLWTCIHHVVGYKQP